MKDEIPVAQDEDLAVGDPAVHPAGHLQDLVRAEVGPGENVAAAFDDVGESRVIDHHGIEALDVERALAGGGHRQHERTRRPLLEEWPDHPDRFAAMVEPGVNAREPFADQPGGLFHGGPRRQEDADAPLLADHALQEPVAEESLGRLPDHLHRGRPGRIESDGLQDALGAKVAGVERRVDRRRQPDEAAPGAAA